MMLFLAGGMMVSLGAATIHFESTATKSDRSSIPLSGMRINIWGKGVLKGGIPKNLTTSSEKFIINNPSISGWIAIEDGATYVISGTVGGFLKDRFKVTKK